MIAAAWIILGGMMLCTGAMEGSPNALTCGVAVMLIATVLGLL